MKTYKICKNPNCQCLFVPNKNNPNQEYCGRQECKHYRDALRQRRYYQRICQAPEKYREMLERKKLERQRRIQRRKELSTAAHCSNGRSVGPHEQDPVTDSRLWNFAAGFLFYTAGFREKEEIEESVVRCMNKGAELLGQATVQ